MEYVNLNCCPITGLSFDDPVAKKIKSYYKKTTSDKRKTLYEYRGEKKSMADWSKHFGFDVTETVVYWKKRGKTIEEIFDNLKNK